MNTSYDISVVIEQVEAKQEITSVRKVEDYGLIFTGFVSYYSYNGCQGCRDDQIMANGSVFDESNYTLAFNDLPLNTLVEVVNMDNGKKVIAKITDRGGFNATGREMAGVPENGLERLADLSLGLCEAIECKTDNSLIEIRELL